MPPGTASETESEDEEEMIKKAVQLQQQSRHKTRVQGLQIAPPPPAIGPPPDQSIPTTLSGRPIRRPKRAQPEQHDDEDYEPPSSTTTTSTRNGRSKQTVSRTNSKQVGRDETPGKASPDSTAGMTGTNSKGSALKGRPPGKPGPKPGPRTVRRPAGAITMKTLVDAGYLLPGSRVVYVDYKQQTTYADLTSEGQIHHMGNVFDSPSAFSIYVKRLLNPTRKADDGWKSVKFNGKLLEFYKEEYLKHMAENGQPTTAGKATPMSSAKHQQPLAMNNTQHQHKHTSPSQVQSRHSHQQSRQPPNAQQSSKGGASVIHQHHAVSHQGNGHPPQSLSHQGEDDDETTASDDSESEAPEHQHDDGPVKRRKSEAVHGTSSTSGAMMPTPLMSIPALKTVSGRTSLSPIPALTLSQTSLLQGLGDVIAGTSTGSIEGPPLPPPPALDLFRGLTGIDSMSGLGNGSQHHHGIGSLGLMAGKDAAGGISLNMTSDTHRTRSCNFGGPSQDLVLQPSGFVPVEASLDGRATGVKPAVRSRETSTDVGLGT